jgi:16S rRNA (adenine1518-N6/adenine1519-N6)-dimethyltransferase
VAERILSDVGSEDYGFLSVVAQSYWDITKVIDAGPQDFHPVPNVGSRVLKFKARKTDAENGEHLKNADTYKKFVKQAFSQRRKKLSSNLGALFSKEKIEGAFIDLKLVEITRAQDLSPEQFIKIFMCLTGEK